MAQVHDTLGSAAGKLGVPKALLSRAKKAGAPGFVGSRVYLEQLIPWLLKWLYETSGLSELDKLDRKIKEEVLRQRKFENDLAAGKYDRKEDVDAWMVARAERLKSVLNARLKNEMPPKLEGLNAPEIAAKLGPVIGELVELFRR